ncbi:uncharacterized protein WCC33_005072 [Rhinophrynus dorsalis]
MAAMNQTSCKSVETKLDIDPNKPVEEQDKHLVDRKITRLHWKRTIDLVSDDLQGFVSNIFVVESENQKGPLQAPCQPGGKCLRKRRHISDTDPKGLGTGDIAIYNPDESLHVSGIEQCGSGPHTGSSPPEDTNGRKRNLRRSKPNSYRSDSGDSSDDDWAPSYADDRDSDGSPPVKVRSQPAVESTSLSVSATPTLVDAEGAPLFDPEGLKHPRSSEWKPRPHIAQFLEAWVRKSITKSIRSKLRAECPRPVVANQVCDTPEVDSKMVQFLSKSGKDPRKGLDQALKSCQDKLLDSLGPLTKIFELSEEALATKSPVDIHVLRGWVQRAICIVGNANCALASERRRALLLRIDPKLADLATTEPGPAAKGLLLGESFIKDLGKFVSSFTALDKAQTSMRKVFRSRVFDKAGRGRGRSPGRVRRRQQQFQGPSYPSSYPTFRGQPPQEPRVQSPFFPSWLVGGRLSRFFHHWCSLTADPWVLQTVKGFHIEFAIPPHQRHPPPPLHFSAADAVLVDSEISTLWRKGAVAPASGSGEGFISNIFLVRKKDSGHRPVINLRELNDCVLYRHFKMEGIHLLRDLLLPSDWLVKIDLQDAYLTVPMAPTSQVFLRFRWHGRIWQFTCLPFGLSSAPWCFTKLLKPVVAFLRSRGIRLIIYLDDMLIMSQDRTLLSTHVSWTVRLLTDLGFLINWTKSQLIPSQRMEFLGFVVDSLEASLSLPAAKICAIRKEIRSVLKQERISLRLLARVVGLLASSIQAIFPGPLHYRALQRLKALHLRRGLGYSELIDLSHEARVELVWWLRHLDAWNGRAIFGVLPDVVIESDASLLGWGARMGAFSTGGKWSPAEASLHINCLELLAGSFALRSLVKDRVRCCILLRMDNVSAVQYINRLGGTRSKPLADLAKDFWHFCLDRDISVVAEHLPGLSNVVADWNSRYLSDRSDWMLHSEVFARLFSLWGPFHIDLFASRLNRRLPQFFSWRPDPEALATDAFLQSWTPGTHYAFPPFSMIPRTLLMIRRQAAVVVVVTPFWPMQAWFPPLLELPLRRSARVAGFRRDFLSGMVPFGGSSGFGGFSSSAETLLVESWAPGTRAMYGSAWAVWSRWCVERGLDPVSSSPVNVVNFLSSLFDSGKAYRTINCYRSAISAGHRPVDGVPIGQSVLVCRLMRGVRFSRPPRSRYHSVWNVNDVLGLLEGWPCNELLSLKQLSAKLTMLLCLVSFKRVSDVRALDFHSRSFTPEGVQFRISRRTKTTIRVVSYPSFPAQPQLCVVRCLREYELRTAALRHSAFPQLLISFRKPFLPVSAATLSRWVRWVMQLAGIDVSLFGAHSTRGAMASMALHAGGRLEDILRAADWSRESTFRDFYCKPIDHVSAHVFNSLLSPGGYLGFLYLFRHWLVGWCVDVPVWFQVPRGIDQILADSFALGVC